MELTPTALVTGGSRGIGRAVAKALAGQGLRIYFTYVSNATAAAETAAEIEAGGGKARAFALDVADAGAVEEFFQREIADKVFLSVLVNNAGVTKDGLLVRMKNEDWDKVLDTNLRGPFICLREAAKIMLRQRSGRIVNVASLSGQTGNRGQANYSSAKAGLIGLTKTSARELASRGITVNAVAPGFIETDMTRALSEEIRASWRAQIPLGRFGSVEDVAGAVAFLASDKAAYITGQVLSVNGGVYC